MKEVELLGADPDHILLMIDGANARLEHGLISMEEHLELSKQIVPRDDLFYTSLDCGCKSVFMTEKDARELEAKDFCKHVSK